MSQFLASLERTLIKLVSYEKYTNLTYQVLRTYALL